MLHLLTGERLLYSIPFIFNGLNRIDANWHGA